jgi:hypothetical protein
MDEWLQADARTGRKPMSVPRGIRNLGGAAVACLALTGAQPVVAVDQRGPVVVELYQSQGCSDCPPAQEYLNRLADRPGVLALSFAVTYWDQLGWKDSFASPRFTQRQRDYAAHNGGAGVATPQFWINGRETILGANIPRVETAIAKAALAGPRIAAAGNHVTIAAGHAPAAADVWVVRYDPRTIAVAISAGENGGRTIPHRDIVRELVQIGHWNGAAEMLTLPQAVTGGLATAILLQDGKGGRIIAAALAR